VANEGFLLMSGNRRLFDDVAKLATSAAGVVQGAGREAELLLRQRLERIIDRMDLVSRDEFDVVKDMASKARVENEMLLKRVTFLEKAIHADNAKFENQKAKKAKTKSGDKKISNKKNTRKTSK